MVAFTEINTESPYTLYGEFGEFSFHIRTFGSTAMGLEDSYVALARASPW
jgi:hypothetical protein